MAPWIVARLPEHDHFIEGCAGSGAVMAVKPPVAAETLNDTYSEVVNFHRVLRDPTARARLIDLVTFTPYAYEEFVAAGEALMAADDLDPVERAWAFLVRMQMAVVPGRTGWSFGKGGASARKANKPGRWATMPALLQVVGERFERVQIEQRDLLELIDRYDAPGVLIFVDPPYTKATRPKSAPGSASAYVEDAFQHEAFLDAALRARHARFAITHYPDPLYDQAGLVVAGDYTSHRNVPNGSGRDQAVERLYLSPGVVHRPNVAPALFDT